MNSDHSAHDHLQGASERRIGIAALLTGIFMLAEVAGGLLSGSLALLADAGHMVTDFLSLGLAWLGFRLARRPADWKRTYGFDRFSILAAFVSGLSLFLVAAWIALEAWHRLQEPSVVLAGVMFWVALAGLIVNLIAFWVLSGGNQENLNMKAAATHVLGDLLGSVAALTASIVILATGWMPIDPILSVAVSVIILRSAWQVVRDSAHILLEAAPEGVDPREISSDLISNVGAVVDIHHVHAWSITQERAMITLHAKVIQDCNPQTVLAAVKKRLHDQFGVAHATVEIEFEDSADRAAD